MTKQAVSESMSCPTGLGRRDDDQASTFFDKQGPLSVKLPPSTRTSNWKVWSRKQVTVKADVIASTDCITNSALVIVHKSDKEADVDIAAKETDLMFKKWFTPQSTVVFRCKSKTQKYGFTICSAAEPVIHFGATTETEAQQWMSAIRNILWPPNSFIELEKTLGSVFEVSIIDNEFSYRAGLLGMYGHLAITSKKAILAHPQTGHVIQEWYLDTIGFKLLVQSARDDEDKVINLVTDSKSSTGYGSILFYCVTGKALIERVHEVRQMFSNSSYGEQVQEQLSKELSSDGSGSLADSYSLYKKPSKAIRVCPESADVYECPRFKFARPLSESFIYDGTESPTRPLSSSPSSPSRTASPLRRAGHSRLFTWKNVANISESMLDSSISSAVSFRSAAGRQASDSGASASTSSSDNLSPTMSQGKIDFYIGEDIEPPIGQQSCPEEGEEDIYHAFHRAVLADGAGQGHEVPPLDVPSIVVTKDDDVPPPLPPKLRNLRLNLSNSMNVNESTPKMSPRRRSLSGD